jgi:hypothetical protein
VAEKLGPLIRPIFENVGPSFYFSGMRQRAVMLELRASNQSSPLAANELGFVGSRGSEFSIVVRPCQMTRSFWLHRLALLWQIIHAAAFRRFVFCSTGIAEVVVER